MTICIKRHMCLFCLMNYFHFNSLITFTRFVFEFNDLKNSYIVYSYFRRVYKLQSIVIMIVINIM